jgi:histidinol phosphatase-like enzyme
MFLYILVVLYPSGVLIQHFSADARERKPNIGYYEYVIEQTRIDPSRTIFVDDKIENVLSARSFGMHGIVFDDQAKVVKQIKNLCGDPIFRGNRFLVSHKKHLSSVTSDNIELSEVLRLFFSLTNTV